MAFSKKIKTTFAKKMITSSMNKEEILAQLLFDETLLLNILKKKQQAYKRAVLKSTKFPLIFSPIHLKLQTKNEWILIVVAESKKDIQIKKVLKIFLIDTENGVYAFRLTRDDFYTESYVVYPPHFFSRYKTRMKVDKQGKDLIAHFFQQNTSFSYDFTHYNTFKKERFVEVRSTFKEGVGLGLFTKSGIIFKTFIKYDMLWGEKGEEIAELEKRRQVSSYPIILT